MNTNNDIDKISKLSKKGKDIFLDNMKRFFLFTLLK